MNVDLAKIKAYLYKELHTVRIPGTLKSHTFLRNEELVDALIELLEFQINDELVAGLSNKIFKSIGYFATDNIDISELNNGIENLATAFESVLKKIALIKYENQLIILHGNSQYKGLMHTTLGSLLRGIVDKVNPKDSSVQNLHRPIVSFNYSTGIVSEIFFNFARNLRNEIHNSKSRNAPDCFNLSKSLLAAYLFAIEENIMIIRKHTNSIFKYLDDLVKEFDKIELKHIQLTGEEREEIRNPISALQALEWNDQNEDISDYLNEPENLETEIVGDEAKRKYKLKKSISELVNENEQFWLIGEPGSGKSTSLQYIALTIAKRILASGYFEVPIPCFIKANQFSKKSTFKEIVAKKLGLSNVENLLSAGKVHLIIDGFNEISNEERKSARENIKEIILNFPVQIIISSRKYGFSELYSIPVFELLPLTNEMIEDYIKKYEKSPEKSGKIFEDLLVSNSLILDFARNPLMLTMLVRVIQLKKSPKNRGQLFYYFMNWFFSREKEKKDASSDVFLKQNTLANIAFKMRVKGITSASRSEVLIFIKEELGKWNSKLDVNNLLIELLGDNILELDADSKVVFYHELILEYFCAHKLQNMYLVENYLEEEYFKQVEWSEPIIMLSGILIEATKLIDSIHKFNIILASRCISAGANTTNEIIENIVRTCEASLARNKKNKGPAITALLELGTPDALRIITKIPTKFEVALSSGISNCQRPEIAVLKLLSFGLTGRNRIRQCLSVFYRKPISESILNSIEVADAQICLLDFNKDVEFRDLELIDNIGISKMAYNHVKDFILFLINNQNVNSAVWRKAIIIAGTNRFIEQCTPLVINRLKLEKIPNGSVFYSLYVTCTNIQNAKDAQELAKNGVKLCFEHGFYLLAFKFIVDLNIEPIDAVPDIELHLSSLASKGRLNILAHYKKLNLANAAIDSFIQEAVDILLKTDKMQPIFENYELVRPYLTARKEETKCAVINYGNRVKIKLGTALQQIKKLSLETEFEGYGVILYYNSTGKHGIIGDVLTLKQFFFRESTIKNFSRNSQIYVRTFVKYNVQDIQLEEPKRLPIAEIELTSTVIA